MVSGVKVSKNTVTLLKANIQEKIQNKAEMAKAEGIQLVVSLAANQTPAAVVMREADEAPISG